MFVVVWNFWKGCLNLKSSGAWLDALGSIIFLCGSQRCFWLTFFRRWLHLCSFLYLLVFLPCATILPKIVSWWTGLGKARKPRGCGWTRQEDDGFSAHPAARWTLWLGLFQFVLLCSSSLRTGTEKDPWKRRDALESKYLREVQACPIFYDSNLK